MKTSKIQLVSALTWAAVILLCSYFSRGSENTAQIFNILIGGAVIHIIWLAELPRKRSNEKTITKRQNC